MLDARGRNQWQFPSQIKSKTKGKKSQQSFKICNEMKTKMQNKRKWQNKMFFELLNFIKRRARRDQENYQIPSQTTLNLKKNFKNAPNIIVPLSSKIYMSKRRQETQ